MDTYKLPQAELDFLLAHIRAGHLLRLLQAAKDGGQFSAEGKYPTGRYVIQLSPQDSDLLVDTLSDLLCEIGLQPDGEPNVDGLLIEDLIDTFGKFE
jgi:hypothetical protein